MKKKYQNQQPKKYLKKIDLEVKDCSKVVNKDEPFLSAIPDGTIDYNML